MRVKSFPSHRDSHVAIWYAMIVMLLKCAINVSFFFAVLLLIAFLQVSQAAGLDSATHHLLQAAINSRPKLVQLRCNDLLCLLLDVSPSNPRHRSLYFAALQPNCFPLGMSMTLLLWLQVPFNHHVFLNILSLALQPALVYK